MNNILCIDVFEGIDYDRLFYMVKDIGFDGLFSGEIHGDDFESMKRVRKIANETGLLYEFSHSKIPGCMELWRHTGGGEDYVKLLKRNIDNCARLEIPILVVHCQPEYQTEPDMALGLKYLEPVVRYAEDAGVKIAFENLDKIIEDIDRKNNHYMKNAASRAKFELASGTNQEGKINTILRYLTEFSNETELVPEELFNVFVQKYVSEESIKKIPEKKSYEEVATINVAEMLTEEEKAIKKKLLLKN